MMKTLKRILSSLLAVVMLLLMAPVSSLSEKTIHSFSSLFSIKAEAVGGRCGWYLNWDFNPETGELRIYGWGAMDDFFYEYSVPWKSYRAQIKTVVIEEGVASIGEHAFYDCKYLTQIIIPDSVTHVGYSAFGKCSSLTMVAYLGSDEQYNNMFIDTGNSYFVEKVASVLHYGDYGDDIEWFLTSTGKLLIQGTGPMNEKEWVPWDDTDFRTLVKSIEIKGTITSIRSRAFQSFDDLTMVKFNNNIKTIGESAFGGYDSIKDLYFSGDIKDWCSIEFVDGQSNPLNISENFYVNNCRINENFVIPDNINTINDYAFYGFSGFKSIVIPDSVSCLGKSAFQYCKNLTNVTLGVGVTDIKGNAFNNCNDSIRINYTGTMRNWCSINFSAKTANPCYYADVYIDNEPIEGEIVIPEGVTSIGKYAFVNCDKITKVILPESLKHIGEDAFGGCVEISDVLYSGGISGWCSIDFVSLLSNPKSYADSLYIDNSIVSGDIIIPGTVACIGRAAFWGCTDITSVSIQNGVTCIKDSAFRGCTNITGVSIPDSVTTIEANAFYLCMNISNINLPDNLKIIGDYAFYGCKKIEKIEIPDSVTSIGKFAFQSCRGLLSVTIGDGVKVIDERTFQGCTKMKDLFIGKNVKQFKTEVFDSCSSLENVYYAGDLAGWCSISFTIVGFTDEPGTLRHSTPMFYADNLYIDGVLLEGNVEIPDSVTKIGNLSFYSCQNITSISIPDSVISIGCFAFAQCKDLLSVSLSSEIKKIDHYTFIHCDSLKKIVIPNSVSSIGFCAFGHCTLVKDIYFTGSVEEWRSIYVDEGNTKNEGNSNFSSARVHFNHTHFYNLEIKDATCEEDGVETSVCECGDILYSKPIEKLGHSFKFVSVKPTCTEVGYECNECEHCQQRNSYVEIPMVPHDLVHSKTPSTCTSRGKECECCTNCGAEFDIVYYPSEEHEWGEWTIETEPTNVADGWEKQKCLNCESYIARKIPMLGEIESVYVNDIGLNYKEFSMIVPTVDIDERVSYSVTYSSSDPSVVTVDENGNIYGAGTGNATITCTVTDEFGNVVSDTCDVAVNYTFGQWLIVILLFGWIWY